MDIFDSIDLADLEGNEDSIIESGSLSTPPVVEKPAENKQEKDGDIEPDTSGVDIDALSELEEISRVSDENVEDEESKANKGNKAPAEKRVPSPTSQDTFTSLASALKEAGAFSFLEEEELEEVKDTASLLEAITKQAKKAELAELNEDQKEYLEALKAGVPTEVYSQRKALAEQYKGISEDSLTKSPNIQKELIKRSFLIKGFDIDKAEKWSEKAMLSDTALEDALEAKEALVAYEEGKLAKEIEDNKAKAVKLEEDNANKLAELKSKINQTSEIIPGFSITTTVKDKIFNSMTTPVNSKSKDPQNEVMQKYATDMEYKLKVHAFHTLTKGFTDFSKVVKTAKSKAVEELEEKLSSGQNGTSFSNSGSNNSFDGGFTTKQIGEALKDLNF